MYNIKYGLGFFDSFRDSCLSGFLQQLFHIVYDFE